MGQFHFPAAFCAEFVFNLCSCYCNY